MPKIQLPYGSGYTTVDIAESNLLGVIGPQKCVPLADPSTLIARALADPIASPTIREAVRLKNAENAVIVITDITRPSPDNLFLPPILDELIAGGIAKNHIKIFIATGMHRACTPEEIKRRLGSEIHEEFNVVNNDACARDGFANLGLTAWGCPALVNRLVVESDFVISTGIIEPHIFAGYSGGRKSVAIGSAAEESIRYQHRPQVLDHPNTRIGQVEGNIFHDNATAISRMAGLDFIINAVQNEEGDVVKVVAGDMERAFNQGVDYARKIFDVSINQQADIVITGVKPPKDANLFQATRGASYVAMSSYPSVKKDGVIIVPARTPEGAGEGPGEKNYFRITSSADSLDEIMHQVRNNSVPAGGHRAFVMALTLKHAAVFVAGSETPDVVEKLFMLQFDQLDDALAAAFRKCGKASKVYVIPDSLHVVTSYRDERPEK